MIDCSRLSKGNLIKSLIDFPSNEIKKGDILRVINSGWSKWDGWHYIDAIAENGNQIEIMKNYMDFETL